MYDYQEKIDRCTDWRELKAVLDELASEVELVFDSPYENRETEQRAHNLELLLRYGEQKLEQMLS